MTLVRRFTSAALDAVFPPRCVSCGDFGAFICIRCLEAAPRADGKRCPRCWLPVRTDRCPSCLEHRPAFSEMRSAFTYRRAPRDAVLSLKFHGVSALAPLMAHQMADVLRDWSPPVDVVVPVPLRWVRSRTRGYNQSELLASEIARACGLRHEPKALRRKRHTAPQARQQDAASRRANVDGAFAQGSRPVKGNVLLIDDVSTTGATLDACARGLIAGGAARVYALTFARED